jgi:hypothetical protein
LVARLVRDQKVAGSNPVTSTSRRRGLHIVRGGFFYCIEKAASHSLRRSSSRLETGFEPLETEHGAGIVTFYLHMGVFFLLYTE